MLAVTPLFLSPFCTASALAGVLLWMSLCAWIWLLMEPSRRNDERLHEARVRVRRAIVRDPLFWLFVLLTVFAGLRALNGGIVRAFDTTAHKWYLAGPKVGLFPGVTDGEGLVSFAFAVSVATLVEGCRQGLGKSARIAVVSMASFFGGVGAFVQLLACRTGHASALAMAGFANGEWGVSAGSALSVSSAGNAYGLCFLASVVAAAGLFECKWNRKLLLFVLSVGTTGTGLFYFASPATFALYAALAVLLAVGCLVYLAVCFRGSDVFKYLVALALAGAIPAVTVICIAPAEMTEFRTFLLTAGSFPQGLFADGFWELRASLSDYAKSFWQEHPWLGQGIGSFPVNLWLAGAATKGVAAEGALNGWWCLLAERGILGILAIVLPFGFMVVTLCLRIAGAHGRHVFLPLTALGIAGVVATIATSLVDCSFLRSDSMLLSGAFFALAASAFPAPRKQAEDEETMS